MDEMKVGAHTQGEWEIYARPSDLEELYIATPGFGSTICTMNKDCMQNEANAKLIAAAPNMLETLIALNKYILNSGLISIHFKNQLEMIESAIKKATL